MPCDIDNRYLGKSVQRPSQLPKESAEYRGWYDALPQKQPKGSAQYGDWYKALPQAQPKKTEAFRSCGKCARALHKDLPIFTNGSNRSLPTRTRMRSPN